MTERTTVVVIGAGHSGLAMSRRLAERSIDHVVLERGEVANSWATERWQSLRLLTPTWQTTLPGSEPQWEDPDGYLTTAELVDYLRRYASDIAAPVQTQTTVTRVSGVPGNYLVETNRGDWIAEAVVVASGGSNLPVIPKVFESLADGVQAITPFDYQSPESLPEGGVLVVGASATGVQLAKEIAESGRQVVLSTGEHVRMPRVYRGKDIFWWMDRVGVLDERYDQMDDIIRARHVPSPQLVGAPDGRSVDLNALQEVGVEIVGRLGRMRDGLAQFSGGLANTARLADLKQERLLDRFDAWAEASGVTDLGPIERPEDTVVSEHPRLDLDLAKEGFSTVLWATGFAPDYSWLDLPVLDYKGKIKHDGGVVTASPGLYVLGTSLLRRRRSTYISGAAQDTEDLAEHLVGYLAHGIVRDEALAF